MQNDSLSYTAYSLVISAFWSIVAMLYLFEVFEVFGEFQRIIVMACFGLSVLGCVLGFCAFDRPLGKDAAIIGSLLVFGYCFIFFAMFY